MSPGHIGLLACHLLGSKPLICSNCIRKICIYVHFSLSRNAFCILLASLIILQFVGYWNTPYCKRNQKAKKVDLSLGVVRWHVNFLVAWYLQAQWGDKPHSVRQGSPFLKIFTCPTSKICFFQYQIIYDLEIKILQIYLPDGQFYLPRAVGQWDMSSPVRKGMCMMDW